MATILILDDDKYFRTLARTALEARGHTVLEAERGAQADTLLVSSWIDLVLVDGLLPDGMGLDWIARFRERDAKTAVVFISAFFKEAHVHDALTLAATLQKPLAPHVLAVKVEAAMRAAGIAPPAPGPRPAIEPADALDDTFRRDLPGLLTGMRTAVAQLRSNRDNAALRGVARRRAHQIAGAAGSFGDIILGEACAGIEEGIVKDDWKQIDAALGIIRHERRAVA